MNGVLSPLAGLINDDGAGEKPGVLNAEEDDLYGVPETGTEYGKQDFLWAMWLTAGDCKSLSVCLVKSST
ncbi:hypothetical protein MLD38_008717 [Melastoma candidum]|uniref:Uncharacterized protein n=1 Tax=Melastoma candidum TaxID=119954 RepID=A0ACB9RZJ5_9MYRT|nr:hypothetical protein MLD38_008717 [Melastoma candidum]